MNTNFPQILKELRTDKSLSQISLANKLGYTQSNVSEWEKGSVEPKLSALVCIANFFDVSIDYLLGLEDDYGAKVASLQSDTYTTEERQLIEDFRQLNYYKRDLIKNNIKAMLPTDAESKKKKV